MLNDHIDELIASHQTGYALARPFYTDPEIFRREIERVFTRGWSFAGHVSRVRRAGDYFLFRIGDESIIVMRGDDEQVHALFNVCRHRGSRVCLEARGSKKAIVCPYHAWTYGCDGALLAAPAMPEGFGKSAMALRRCAVRVVEGMIFVRLGDDSPEVDGSEQAFAAWKRYLKPHRLADAKIAASMYWQVEANWKLVVENFGECYHCRAAHPEYCAVMAHAAADTHRAPRAVEEFSQLKEKWERDVRQTDLALGVDEGPLHQIGRIPIREGFVTQSRDGKPVAPLMGDLREYDGGYTSGRIYPLNYVIACADHALIPRFTPTGPTRTEVEMIWLVHPDAVEGRDYDVARLTWLWKVTTDQDKILIDNNQLGVNSAAYRPGPYSLSEEGLTRFTMWYLNQLSASDAASMT